jgi:carboxypeptidase C (cathepsin A)
MKIWTQNESICIDVLDQVLLWTNAQEFRPKRWTFLQTLSKIEVGNYKKYEHRAQVSRYDIFNGIF